MPESKSTNALRRPSLWSLHGRTVWQLCSAVIRETQDEDLFGTASNLAFNWLLALFPMLLFMLALFGIFASHHRQLEDSLFSFTAGLLPYDAYQLLDKVANELAEHSSGGKATIGILLALALGSGGMSSLMSTMNVASRVRETRSWWKVRAIALVLTLVISILLLLALFTMTIGGAFLDWAQMHFGLSATLPQLGRDLRWPAAAVFVAISCSLVDYFGPNVRERRWHWFTPGSVVGVILWLAACVGFRAYLHFFNTYSTTYGSLGAVMILLVWLYVTAFAFLIGGAINAEIERRAMDSIAMD